jgi:adenylate cyclase
MQPLKKRYRTFPLRFTLVVSVVGTALLVIALVIGAVGVPAYRKAKGLIRGLWEQMAKEVALNATEQVLRYFQSAPSTLKVIEGLVEEEQLALDSVETLLDICYRTLRENPSFMNVFYAKTNGQFYGVFRFPDRYEGSYRFIDQEGKTKIQNYRIGPHRKWVESQELSGDYDPRTRPFWQTGSAHPEGGWTTPYQFATTGAQGYTYVLAQKGKLNIEGYWAIDFQIDQLSDFLHSLPLGSEGTVSIVSENGSLIADSHQNKTPLGKRIFYENPFPKAFGIPWKVVVSVHEDDFLKPIRSYTFHALGYGLIPTFLFLILIGLFFGRVSRSLKEIAWDMDAAGYFTFHSSQYRLSRIKEINAMHHALTKMKVGIRSLMKYVPLDLIKKLIQSGKAAERGAESREVTVFFADLAGFTSLAEHLQPPEVAALIEMFLTEASKQVHAHKGMIDKFMGDAIMALWGVLDPLPNPALSACRAALALGQALQSDPRMKHRIGINTGMAMVGHFGSEERIDYTALGDTVNIASRLEKLNKQYETTILIGSETAAAVKETLLVRPINWVLLEGRATPLLIYELLGEKAAFSETILQAVAVYTSGLESYKLGDYSKAVQLFSQANDLFGGSDRPSQILKALSQQNL